MTEPTYVISGGGTGIGAATAKSLSGQGNHVTVIGRRPGPIEQVADEIDGSFVVADVSTPDGAERVAAELAAAGRTCAGVVAAAGGLVPSENLPGLQGIRSDWQASFDSNVLSAVLLVEALRSDLEQGGRVVLLSSVAGIRGSGGGPYGAMKSALHAWMFDLAAQLGPAGGTANVVAPGFVPDTGFWAGRLTEENKDHRRSLTLVGREGHPDEIASLIGWLLGPDGGWVTGQIISPNGGLVLGR